MGLKRRHTISWKCLIPLIGELFLLEIISLAGVQSECMSGRYQIQQCSQELLSGRHVITTLESGDVDTLSCVRKCSRDNSCGLAVVQAFSDGHRSSSCALLSFRNQGQGSTLDMSRSRECDAIEMSRSRESAAIEIYCKNKGWMYNGVCVCPDGFKGEYCEHVNPRPCNGQWRKAFSYDKARKEMTVHNSTLLQPLMHYVPKLRVRGEFCLNWRLFEILHLHKSEMFTHIHLSKSCPPQHYRRKGKRMFRKFSTDGDAREALELGHRLNKSYYSQAKRVDYEIWLLDESPFTDSVEVSPDNIAAMKERLQSGSRVLDYNSVLVLDRDISLSLTQERLVFPDAAHLYPGYWYNNKISFSLTTTVTRPLFCFDSAVQEITNRTFNPGERTAYLEPCWFPVQQPVGDLGMFRKKLKAYLDLGKDMRVLVGRTYVDVLEIIQEEEEIYAVLVPTTSEPGPGPYSEETEDVRAFVSTEGQVTSCRQSMESERISWKGTEEGGRPSWFVDSRNWKAVYAVFTNATVANGDLSELGEAVKTARTVRLRLSWLHLSRMRYLDTAINTVLDTGKVNTETRATWKLYDDNRPGLDFNAKCDQELLMVNTEGRIEVAHFNVFTPSVLKILTDEILITWFIN